MARVVVPAVPAYTVWYKTPNMRRWMAVSFPTEEAATHRVAELSQAQLAFAYDVTAIGFSKVWLPMGVFALACGWGSARQKHWQAGRCCSATG